MLECNNTEIEHTEKTLTFAFYMYVYIHIIYRKHGLIRSG